MKICTKCQTEKPVEEFYFFNKEKNQRINRCRECHKQAAYEWQKKNPLAMKKAWTKHNRDRKFRFCSYCGQKFKFACAQKECSYECKFWNSIRKNDNGCWDWKKSKDLSGYGLLCKENRHLKAHRFSYELHHGKIPEKMYVCHTCDRPMCVNPAHLFLGTHQDNMNDMNRKGRGNAGRTHFRKYDREKCRQVISLRNKGKLYREISAEVGIPESACKFICKHPERLEVIDDISSKRSHSWP